MTEYAEKLRSWYDKTAKRYDDWGDISDEYSSGSLSVEVEKFRLLLSQIPINKDSKVLDVATGTGIYLLEALKKAGIGYGVDISEEMLHVLREKIAKFGIKNKIGGLVRTGAEKLPYSEEYFDLVLCIGLFDYYSLDECKEFMKEILRVLKPEGYAIIDFPNIDDPESLVFRDKERSVGHEVYLNPREELHEFINKLNLTLVNEVEAGIEIQFLVRK